MGQKIEGFFAEFKGVIRSNFRSPGFALSTAVTLGVGIGVTTALYSVVDGALLEPLPYPAPEEMVEVRHRIPDAGSFVNTPATYLTYRDWNRSFAEVGAWMPGRGVIVGTEGPERVDVRSVTPEVFKVLGLEPAIGRFFDPSESASPQPSVVVVSHEYWSSRLGSDQTVLGRTLRLDGTPTEVVGVLPPGFTFLDETPELLVPLYVDPSAQQETLSFDYRVIARLREGATVDQATTDINRMLPQSVEFYAWVPPTWLDDAGVRGEVVPLRSIVVGDIGPLLWALMGMMTLVLVMAWANVVNLYLVRSKQVLQETRLRQALGAGRGRMATRFLTEALLLSAVGGMIGLFLADLVTQELVRSAPGVLPRANSIRIDPSVLLFAAGASTVVGALVALVPLSFVRETRLASALAARGRTVSDTRRGRRIRNVLAGAQVAVALTLLTGAGLLVRSARSLGTVDPGFERPEEVLTLRIDVPRPEVPDDGEAIETYARIIDGISRLPGVVSVGAASGLELESRTNGNSLLAEAPTMDVDPASPVRVGHKAIAGPYLSTIGVPLLAGREISWEDVRQARPVGVITETLATRFWGSPEAALGQRVRHTGGDPWREVVGVVGQIRDRDLRSDPTSLVYWPMAVENFLGLDRWVRRSMAIAVRAEPGIMPGLLPSVRETVWEVNPSLAIDEIRTMKELVDRSFARTTWSMQLLLLAAAVALMLATIGVFGVVSNVAAERTRAIGIHMALGADRVRVMRGVARHGAGIALGGLAVGSVLAVLAARALGSLLFGVGTVDPVTLFAASVALGVVTFGATWIPARRAARSDPMTVLREE
jgi:predicted permease